MIYCDPETGICDVTAEQNSIDAEDKVLLKNTLLYFGDPMCSWCWGIAPEIDKLKDYFTDTLDFKLIMGGLRPGGGESWNDRMKQFLRNHWEHVTEKSGQPFSFDLLDREEFSYDTEPPCRSVKVAQSLDPAIDLPFYHDVQYQFYVENKDPAKIGFYESICKKNDISFGEFSKRFESDTFKARVQKEFRFTQQLGVSAFPTVLLQLDQQLQLVTYGYSEFEQMKSRIEQLMQKMN